MTPSTASAPGSSVLSTVSVVFLVLLGLGGLLGGVAGLMDPVSPLGMPPEFIKGSPFPDYFFPSLILLFVNGLAPLTIAVLLLRCHPLGPLAMVAQGTALVGWILVQVWLLNLFFAPLHGTFLALGVVLLLLGLAQLPRGAGVSRSSDAFTSSFSSSAN